MTNCEHVRPQQSERGQPTRGQRAAFIGWGAINRRVGALLLGAKKRYRNSRNCDDRQAGKPCFDSRRGSPPPCFPERIGRAAASILWSKLLDGSNRGVGRARPGGRASDDHYLNQRVLRRLSSSSPGSPCGSSPQSNLDSIRRNRRRGRAGERGRARPGSRNASDHQATDRLEGHACRQTSQTVGVVRSHDFLFR